MPFQWTPNYWKGWRESANPYRSFKSERDRTLTVDALQLRDGESVLEVGCGYGWITEALHRAARIHWVGVDSSAAMVGRLRNSLVNAAPNTFVCDARRLPFASASFDKALCTGVLMHLPREFEALKEIWRVLRPGGRLVCSINNALSPFSAPVRVWNLFKSGFVQNFRVPASFGRRLGGLGFEVCETSGDGLLITVPIQMGRFSFPPRFAFSFLHSLDRWGVEHAPWLAYEVWFSATKK